MVKYLVLMDDKPIGDFSGVLQLLRYSKREEYLTMEYREVDELGNIDISEKPKVEVNEIAVNNEEIIKLRDFLNGLDLNKESSENSTKLRG